MQLVAMDSEQNRIVPEKASCAQAEPAQKRQSDLKRAFAEDGALKTHVGGQALIEGVMMRGKFNWAAAVREPSGKIYVEEHDLASGKKKNGWLYWPIVRGCRAFVESLVLGYKALEIAALHAYAEVSSDDSPADGGAEGACAAAASSGVQSRHDSASSPNEVRHARETPSVSGAAEPPAGPLAEDSGDDAVKLEAFSTPEKRAFSWKDDFGNPDEMIDALGAQRSLEVVCEPASPAAAREAAQACGDAYARPFEASVTGSAPTGSNPAQDVADAKQPDVAVEASAKGAESASIAENEEETVEFGKKEMAISMALGMILGVVLFIVAPAFIANLLVGEYDAHTLAWNIVDGIVRVAIFVFYIWLIGRMQDIKRMFGYHGAEHKTIHCYEHDLPLTPENARSFPRLHVRCGTAFLIMVKIIAIFVYTITPLNALIAAWGVPDGPIKLALVIVVRIVLMPVIAGISYEITVKWAGSHPENPLVKVILWPGMQMQKLTTREPDDGQIECASEAMQTVLEREEREAAKAGA